MFVYQLIFYLQRVHLFDYFRQFADTGNIIQMHDAYHFSQHTGEM